MRFSIDIDYPVERMESNRKRMQARYDFRYVDRVPVLFCVVGRYFAPLFGIEYKEFFKDAETQYYWQLQFMKYRLENIAEDFCQGTTIFVAPYFDNVINASAFGAEIAWPDNETLQAIPVMNKVEDIEAIQIPEPDSGLWGTVREWWLKMRVFARETKITFNGQEGSVDVAPLTIGGEGPHMIAVDLAGTNFYTWMKEYPDACHRLLDKITRGMIRAEKYNRKIDPRPRSDYAIAEDSIQICSSDMFREYCIPYDEMLYSEFGAGLADGRGMHMCGDSVHLHRDLIEGLKISSFNIFGYQVPPEVAAENMGGKCSLWGNINPMLMLKGSKDEVKKAAEECLEALAPCGGFMLGDGANVCPGTPSQNLAVLMEAAEEYGTPSF
jgi:uroporphyrinogen-III decarboxylase